MKRPWLCILAGCALGEVLAYAFGDIWWIPVVIVVIAMVGLYKKRSLLIISIAFLIGTLRMGADELTCPRMKELDSLCETEESSYYEDHITDIEYKSEWTVLELGQLQVYCKPAEAEGLKIGNKIRIIAKVSKMSTARNEGEFNYRLYYRALGITHRCFADNIKVIKNDVYVIPQFMFDLRQKLLSRISQLYNELDAGVLRAALLGDKSMMNDDLYDLYRKNGIAHLLAISGLHVGILGMGLYSLLRKRLKLSFLISAIIASILISFYSFITGLGVSTVRASIMLILVFSAGALGRRSDMLNSIGLAGTIVLLLHPYQLFTCGFLLSFACVIAISGPATYIKKTLKIENELLLSFVISLTISIFTLPITAYFFFEVSLLGCILNLIVIPLMTYVVWSGIAATILSFIVWPVAVIAAGSGHYILNLYTFLGKITSKFPFSTILIGRPKLWQIGVYYLFFFAVLYSSPSNLRKLMFHLSMLVKEMVSILTREKT